ncbi:MAG: M1 family peptidase, partial [Ferruginibacter sp.]
MRILLLFISLSLSLFSYSQVNRWQQKANYVMKIDMDVNTNKFSGTQVINYTNNSPDNLSKVYFNLYLNAFQPNSSMDLRSRELGKNLINGRSDWDSRIKDTISSLSKEEIGYQKIKSLKLNGVPQKYFYHETILEVKLSKPIASGTTVKIEVEFDVQVPIQIRRTGRDNAKTNVRYSMSQWY